MGSTVLSACRGEPYEDRASNNAGGSAGESFNYLLYYCFKINMPLIYTDWTKIGLYHLGKAVFQECV